MKDIFNELRVGGKACHRLRIEIVTNINAQITPHKFYEYVYGVRKPLEFVEDEIVENLLYSYDFYDYDFLGQNV